MRIILCGGGTAGHVTPAIAIAEEIRKAYPDSAILFIGREGGNENRAVQKSDIALRTISLSGLKRSLSPKNIKVISDALKAKRKAKEIIRENTEDAYLKFIKGQGRGSSSGLMPFLTLASALLGLRLP